MDTKIKQTQKRVLAVFSKVARSFALAGGTALELYYLQHRFSWDLDFFSPRFDRNEINQLITTFKTRVDKRIKLEAELKTTGRANVCFYTMQVSGATRPLKIDFIEDVLIQQPKIEKKEGVRVYSVENIYFQKVAAIAGTRPASDDIGRPIQQGRNEARDVFDLFMLSLKIKPLHEFLRDVARPYQIGLVHWYRTFSRQDLKLALLDMDIYDPKFSAREIIIQLETEIKLFMQDVIDS
jgi:predicted nucleotidyltransferase component of viral defense system